MSSSPFSSHLRAAVALLPLLASGGCFSSCDDPEPAARTASPTGSPTALESADARPLTDPTTQVARGEAIVQIGPDGRATVLANHYPRLGLLGKLSREAGFEQQRTRTQGERSSEVTVAVIDGSVEEAIGGILSGLDYHLHYSFDESADETRLAKVTIGELASRSGRERERKLSAAKSRHPNSARGRQSSGDELRERAEALENRDERLDRRAREIEDGLNSGSDEIRVAAVDRMQPQGEELETLKNLLDRDPSPAVRASAAERLEGGFGGTAVDALISALNDPDPGVVTAAIEALEFAAEADHIPAILGTGVTRHPNPEVRRAAIEALEFIED